jgi:hypothetical protein
VKDQDLRDARVDAYIAAAPDFAQPILTHLRHLVHRVCPEAVETIKWRIPSFEYKGLLCGTPAFKSYCAFVFWKAPLLVEQGFDEVGDNGRLSRMSSTEDLPSDARLTRLLEAAMALNDAGVKLNTRKTTPKPALKAPSYFLSAIRKNRKAQAAYEKFPPSHKREYIEWITHAKTNATRDRRVAQAVAWMAEGKPRNWKYMKG